MEFLQKTISAIQALDQTMLKRYLLAFLGCICVLSCFIIYYVFNQKHALLGEIKALHTLASKSVHLIEDNKKMSKEEMRLKDLLDRNKDFTIKGFFEQFCRDQGLNPEAGWDARSDEINEKFDEVWLPATFKNQTTEKLVGALEALDEKEIVYIKDLVVQQESAGKISFTLTIATKRYKASLE
jgi:hypothetical protein